MAKKLTFKMFCIFNAIEWWVRRKNVPGLIGKLRYKDDSLNFIFVRKYAHSKNISM